MQKYFPITREGLIHLKEEKEKLLEKRPQIVESLKIAREMGDLSENAAYKVARMELSSIDSRLRYLQKMILTSKVVISEKTGYAGIASRVRFRKDGQEGNYQIVGSVESDPSRGKISHVSPIGRALMGKKAGDKVAIETPRGRVFYEILSID